MIDCSRCGFANAAGASFCDSCHAFLEWSGETQAPPAEPPAVPPREPDGAPRRARADVTRRGVSAVASPPGSPVVPGGRATVDLRVRNTGQVVDAYVVEAVGPAAGWVRVEPRELRLFPGAEAVARLTIAPPRAPRPRAGPLTVDLRVGSIEHADVQQRVAVPISIEPFAEVSAAFVPRSVRGRRSASGSVTITNAGNAAVPVSVAAEDPERLLSLDVETPALTIEPESGATVGVRARAPGWRIVGDTARFPFLVRVAAPGRDPIALDAAMLQPSLVGRWVATLAGAAVVAVAAFGLAVAAPGSVAPTPTPDRPSAEAPSATGAAPSAPSAPASVPASQAPAAPTDGPTPAATERPTKPPPTEPPPTEPPTEPPPQGTARLGYNDVWLERSGSTGSLQVAATVVNLGDGAADGFAAGCSYTCPENPGIVAGGADILNGGYLEADSSETYRAEMAYSCASPQPVFELSCVIVTPELEELGYVFTVTVP